jgi:MFS family permease
MVLERNEQDWLRTHADDWVGAGLISEQQAEAIRHFEHFDEPVAPRRLTLVAEVATYLGAVIALSGGAAIVGPNWDRIGLVGQLAIGVAIAAVALIVGRWLMGIGELGTERLGSFLWMVGAGGMALATGAVMNSIDPKEGAWYPLAIGGVVLAVGLALWRNLERPLQLLTAVIGVVLVGIGSQTLTDLSVWVSGPTVWIASAVFGVLAARSLVRPRLVALGVAAVGLMAGSLMLSSESERLAAIVAMATAALIVAFAMHDRSIPLLVLGMGAFFIATTSMMQTVLHGMVARMIAVVIGLAVVAYVAVRAQRMGGPQPHAG